jgi:hypothetical protein
MDYTGVHGRKHRVGILDTTDLDTTNKALEPEREGSVLSDDRSKGWGTNNFGNEVFRWRKYRCSL